ncbi:phospholipase A2 inhibitor and Ly6/PLAUR domain-containing protein-like [Chelonia mydas]|uniref:phospholipase A2 inhibitor and Ly6/PLAUR domain-containing protein-like n=1 Tax=Chelonia mydas TaxID=8469 RepID=UPI0018A22BC9|nr:phospholipase A2 inhibitor and Ly6/PLAUR domain-containing protein-like [Chelonia mydas]
MWVALPLCLLSALLATVENSFSYTGKSCLEPKNCEPGPFSLTYAHNVTMRVNIACCDTDGCNAGAIPVPTVSSIPNGRQCLSFFKIWADGWQEKEKELLACTGAEDHCVEESGILTLGGITLTKITAGCVSPGTCVKRVGERKYAQGMVEMLIRANCFRAPRAGVLPFCCVLGCSAPPFSRHRLLLLSGGIAGSFCALAE